MTVSVRPATVKVPDRVAVDVFVATVYPTVPLPEPLAPLVTAIHELLLVAVQAQPVLAVTAVVALPPAAGSDCDAGEIEYEQL